MRLSITSGLFGLVIGAVIVPAGHAQGIFDAERAGFADFGSLLIRTPSAAGTNPGLLAFRSGDPFLSVHVGTRHPGGTLTPGMMQIDPAKNGQVGWVGPAGLLGGVLARRGNVAVGFQQSKGLTSSMHSLSDTAPAIKANGGFGQAGEVDVIASVATDLAGRLHLSERTVLGVGASIAWTTVDVATDSSDHVLSSLVSSVGVAYRRDGVRASLSLRDFGYVRNRPKTEKSTRVSADRLFIERTENFSERNVSVDRFDRPKLLTVGGGYVASGRIAGSIEVSVPVAHKQSNEFLTAVGGAIELRLRPDVPLRLGGGQELSGSASFAFGGGVIVGRWHVDGSLFSTHFDAKGTTGLKISVAWGDY